MNFLPSTPQLALLAAMGIMIWVMWRRSHKHFGRGGTAHRPIQRVSKLDDDRDLALIDAPPEINRWQVEMHDLARDLKGEIDTKLALLQILIRQADAAAAKLSAAADRAERLGMGESRDPLDAIERWQPEAARQETPSPSFPQRDEIYALADDGFSAVQIAERTGLSLGDIEMALSLREKV